MNAFAHTLARHQRTWALPLMVSIFFSWNTGTIAQETVQPVPAPTPAGVVRPVPPPPPIPFAPRPGQANSDLPIVQKIAPGLYSLGDIQISKDTSSLSLPAVINMNKGMLEYLLVRTGGKTHESLLRTHIDPTLLQLAMLLIGAEGTDHPLSRQGDPDAPRGNPVNITVSFLKNGRMVPLNPEAWIARKEADKLTDSGPLHWVFTGSVVHNGRFMAQMEGSIISIYRDPVALIDNASPGAENDRVWFVNESIVPPVGTPVTLTISIKK